MINYSIVMRPVNANLIEINQAKSRINAAKAKGETPDAADVALVQTEIHQAFAVAQYTDVMTIEKFARHIANHGCVYSRADISAILYLAVDCMREQLLEGRKIRLGDLGDFSVTINSKGAENAKKFSPENITAVNVVWDCGKEFENMVADAEFNLVPSRSAQAALLKAIKNGDTVVDLSTGGSDAPTNPDDDNPSGGNNVPSGDSAPSTGSGTDGGGSSNVTPEPENPSDPSAGSGNSGSGETEPEQIFIGTSVNDSRMGSVSGMGTYDKGTTVTLKATANAGYRFVSWGDDVTDNPRVIKAEVNGATYSAIFEAIQ